MVSNQPQILKVSWLRLNVATDNNLEELYHQNNSLKYWNSLNRGLLPQILDHLGLNSVLELFGGIWILIIVKFISNGLCYEVIPEIEAIFL